MKSHLRYAKYLALHKWYVFLECKKRGLLIRGIIHDYDKFYPSRWNAYRNFFSNGIPTPEAKEAFRVSWQRHAYLNDHHWQHWVSIHDNGEVRPHELSEKARKEMLADWIGAHKAQRGKSLLGWYVEREVTILIAPKTKKWIKAELIKLEPRS